jgi:hypothetical protein
MKRDEVSTKRLLYAKYRYEHCDGDCSSCPCHTDYRCYDSYEAIIAELERRESNNENN